MKLMLTSFGAAEDLVHLSHPSAYRGIPPVIYNDTRRAFIPDFNSLLLCQEVVFDKPSFDMLVHEPSMHTNIAEAFETLHQEGFVELTDYNALLKKNASRLEEMVRNDLNEPNQWLSSLETSLRLWERFLRGSKELWMRTFTPPYSVHALHGTTLIDLQVRRLKNEGELRGLGELPEGGLSQDSKLKNGMIEVLKEHLIHVNSTVILSKELGIPFHDWADFEPFYRKKFLYVGELLQARKKIEQTRRLFEVSFPEFAITDVRSLVDALKDKRIEKLRDLVQDAVDGRVKFDRSFAGQVLKDVLGNQRKTKRYHRITSYLTLPLGLMSVAGGLAGAVISDAGGRLLDHKVEEKYQWLYMLSDVSTRK